MSLTNPSRTVACLAAGASTLILVACAGTDADSTVTTTPPTSVAAATTEPPSVVTDPTAPDRDDHDDHDDLEALLDQLVIETGLPAVGVTAFTSDRIIEAGVAGVRRVGDPTPVELDDRFSIGSDAKAMTATLVATFVDDGVIGWDTTVAEVFQARLPDVDPIWEAVTIRHLLNHTSGIDDDADIDLDLAAPLAAQRHALVDLMTAGALPEAPGRYAYSNIGYTLAGVVLEELTGQSFEELMQARLFDVIGMDSCGFYAPGTPGQVDEPWGHYDLANGAAIDPGDPDADLPHVIAPSGLIHCSMADWVRFLQSQLRGFRGSATEIITPESFDAMRTTPSGSDYALGWVVGSEPNGTATFYHHGSNRRFTAEVWLMPGDDWGLVTITNLGSTLANPLLGVVDQAMFDRRTS